MLVDISLNTLPYVGKITNHALLVECFLLNRYSRLYAMPVQVSTLARMVHQAVSVAKIDFFGNGVHSY